MTRLYGGPGYEVSGRVRPPVECRVCKLPIQNPVANQRVHPGACKREHNRRLMAKYHAKKRAK